MEKYEEIVKLKAELEYLQKNEIIFLREKRKLENLKQELSKKSEKLKKKMLMLISWNLQQSRHCFISLLEILMEKWKKKDLKQCRHL